MEKHDTLERDRQGTDPVTVPNGGDARKHERARRCERAQKFERARKSERGQSFVELAISLVFLLTLFAAMIDLGWAFYSMVALRDAAQEAAVYASMCPNHTDLIIDRLQQSATAPLDISDIPTSNVRVCVVDSANPPASCDAGPALVPALGRSMRIEVWINHEIRTPFVAAFIGTTTYPLAVNVSDAILRVKDTDCQ